MIQESLQVLTSLIEQTMATGTFKRLADLDFVRQHHANIEKYILTLENQLSMLTKPELQQEVNDILRTRNQPRSIHRGELADHLDHLRETAGADPMDAFLIAGQSNARGKGNSAQAPDPQADTVYQLGDTNAPVVTVIPVTNDVGFTEGSAWPAMGITWYQMTRRRICFMNLAVDSTSLSPVVNNAGAGDWSPSGAHFQSSVAKAQLMVSTIEQQGFEAHFRGVIWGLGESDAAGINASQTTKAAFKDQLRELIAGYRAIFGADMPFYIVKTGTRTDQNDAGYADVRNAEEEIVAEDPHRNKFLYRDTFGFVARGMMRDVVHYNQFAQNEIGREAPAVILGGKDPK